MTPLATTLNAQLAAAVFQEFVLEDRHRVLQLVGESKLGKTHLMRDVFQKLCQPYSVCCVYIVLDGANNQTPKDLLDSARGLLFRTHQICFTQFDQIIRELKLGSVSIENTTVIASRIDIKVSLEERIWSLIPQLMGSFLDDLVLVKPKIVFLLDAFDQAPLRIQEWVIGKFLVQLSQLATLRVVLASRRGVPMPESYSHLTTTHPLGPVKEDQEYIDYCRRVGISLEDDQIRLLAEALDYKPGFFVEFTEKYKRG